MDLRITVVCANCGNELVIDESVFNPPEVRLMANPCEYCIDEAERAAREEAQITW